MNSNALAKPSRASAARALWLDYAFPGNVRELKNIVIRLQTKHPGTSISPAQLADELDQSGHDTAPSAAPLPSDFDAIVSDAMRQLENQAEFSLDEALREQERAYVEAALRMADGNVSKAARLLGINRTTLYNRMDSLGLPRPQGTVVQ